MEEEKLIIEEEIPQFYNKHYIIVDKSNNVISGWSDGPHPEKDITNAICINEQGGYQFCLFADGEENPPLFDNDFLPIYKYENEKIIPLTQIEKNILKTLKEDRNLPIIKSQLIVDSKKQLEQFLAEHPLIWTDKKPYSVTQEKQSLLTEQLALYAMDSNIPLYWNASGEPCKIWPIASLASLAKAIAEYVRPYVQYQQHKESEINSAETADEARNIVIDYNEV